MARFFVWLGRLFSLIATSALFAAPGYFYARGHLMWSIAAVALPFVLGFVLLLFAALLDRRTDRLLRGDVRKRGVGRRHSW